MTSQPLLRRTAHLGAALLLSGGLAACGDDEPEPGARPSTTVPETSAPTESPEPSESEPAESEPAVDPATGEVFEGTSFTVIGPDGWSLDAQSTRVGQYDSGPPKGNQLARRVFGLISVVVGDATSGTTLDDLAAESVREDPRQADTTVGGQPAYRLANEDQAFNTDEELGLVRGEESIVVNVALLGGSEKQRQRLLQSVLASWQWSS
jgi:hypothetical protein